MNSLLVLNFYFQLIALPHSFDVKVTKEQKLWIEENYLVVWPNIKMIPNSSTDVIGTLHAAFPILSDAWIYRYSTGDK